MTRSHSSSLMSAVGLGRCSTPALLKATSRRPNASTSLSSAALHVWSPSGHVARDGERPAAELRRSARLSPGCRSLVDVGDDDARRPSRAKASAVARPMPLPAPVTNATLPENLALLFVVIVASSGP